MRWLSLLWFGLPIVGACTGAPTTTGFAPVTSVILHADAIIPAAQCGTGADQIAKYTAVISSTDSGVKVLSGQTYECFADALFGNMLGVKFDLDVFEWSGAAYTAAMTPKNEALPIGSVETMLHSQCNANVPCQNGYACFGTCVPTCEGNQTCPTGFGCENTTKACTTNPQPCTLSTDCTNLNVCVQARCVPPCGTTLPCADQNQVCVAGGCLPDGGQAAIGLQELMKHTPTIRKHCVAYQVNNVQAVAQCSNVVPGMDGGSDGAADAASDGAADAATDSASDN